VARKGKRRDVYRVLVGKTVGKRPPERPRYREKTDIILDFKEL
jgi:hypothetical protein